MHQGTSTRVPQAVQETTHHQG
uniref:Uncharacterized protein n=1 Tax=Arundo donax TaxID=35708 RepID=A0A0A9EBC0_ARUDO